MRNILLFFFEILILIILLGLYFIFMPMYFSFEYFGLILFLSFISLCFFLLRNKPLALRNNYFTITSIFLLSFCIVHFQIYIDYFFNLRKDLGLTYYLNYNLVPKAVTLASISLVSFFVGSMIYSVIKGKKHISNQYNLSGNFSFVFLRACIVVFFALFIIVTPKEYFLDGYGEFSNTLGKTSYLQYKVHQLLRIMIWAYLCCMAIKLSNMEKKISFFQYVKKMNLEFLIILGIYFILVALSGDRGPIIYTTVLFFACYFTPQGKKLNLKNMVIFVCLAAIVFQFLGYFRGTDSSMGFSDRVNQALIMKDDVQSRGDTSIFPPSVELAQSLRAYHAVIMDQEINSTLWGMGNLDALLGIIPGLGLLIQFTTSYSFINSANYITNIMGSDHGMGTTALADIYLNYGFWGIIVVFSIFGYFFAKLDRNSFENFKENSFFMQVTFLVFVSYAIYIGRATFVGVFSDVIMVWVFVKLASLVHKLRR